MNICKKSLEKLIKEICTIPSPSGLEAIKAEFIKRWLIEHGVDDCIIDEKNNVIVNYGNAALTKIVFMAHIDTVYSLDVDLKIKENDETIRCPSVSDNSANVAGLMMAIEQLIKNKVVFKNYNLMFVFSACEEGLGNSDGCRYFMQTYKNIKEFYTVDGPYSSILCDAVGSHRYEISVCTKGGHSYTAFGNENSIHIIAQIIDDLYKIVLPKNNKTTFNVGTIKGGTTINSIASSASMLYEYRSDNNECLHYMQDKFNEIISKHQKSNCEIIVRTLGNRPCSKDVNQDAQELLLNRIEEIHKKVLGRKSPRGISCTDGSIPLSMGIPASSISVYLGEGNHSANDELLFKHSLVDGVKLLMETILSYS